MEPRAQKTCYLCGTRNEPDYRFCKNCGAALGAPDGAPQNAAPGTPPPYATPAWQTPDGTQADVFDGVGANEMQAYVGKNANRFLPVFTRMKQTGRRASWCWPVFVLGFFFGLIGQSFWFFYRKMYRVGLILAAVGVLLLGVQTAVTYRPAVRAYATVFSTAQDMAGAMFEGDEAKLDEIFDVIDDAIEDLAQAGGPVRTLTGLLNLTAVVLVSVFAFYIYLRSAEQKIRQFTERNAAQGYDYYQIAALGGTSGGALALSIVFYVLFSLALTLAPLFAALSLLR